MEVDAMSLGGEAGGGGGGAPCYAHARRRVLELLGAEWPEQYAQALTARDALASVVWQRPDPRTVAGGAVCLAAGAAMPPDKTRPEIAVGDVVEMVGSADVAGGRHVGVIVALGEGEYAAKSWSATVEHARPPTGEVSAVPLRVLMRADRVVAIVRPRTREKAGR